MNEEEPPKQESDALKWGYLISVAGLSALAGFGMTLGMARKRDPQFFAKGLSTASATIPESGHSLAMRALGYGTLYSVTGVTLLSWTVWKCMRVKDLKEFREKAGNFLPRIPKKETPEEERITTMQQLLDFITKQ